MFAQHPGVHAFSLGAFVAIQLAAGNRTVAAPRASPIVKDAMILLSIALIYTCIRIVSRVENLGSAPKLGVFCHPRES
jgi:hypothetical protein